MKLFSGLSFNLKGMRYFWAERSLWKFAFVPFVINILFLVGLISLYVSFFGPLFEFITSPLGNLDIAEPSNALLHLADAGLWFLRYVLMIVFAFISLVVIFLSVFFLSMIINSPFYEAMAERVLELKGIRQEQAFSWKRLTSDLVFSLKIESFKFVFFLGVSAVLFILSLIPGIGLVFSFLGLFFTAWVFAFGVASYPLMLNHESFGNMLRWGRKHSFSLLGFGLPALIPLAGFFLAPFQVVGGTLLSVSFIQAPAPQENSGETL